MLGALPESFTEGGIASFGRELPDSHLIVAKVGDVLTGLATWVDRGDTIAELTWLAVDPSCQHAGLGTALVAEVETQARNAGATEMEVKTLAEGPESPAYELTRRFYQKLGYELREVIDPYPAWEPGNPCAIYRKLLAS